MKPIKGYKNLYSITPDGRVFSHRKKIYLKPYKKRQPNGRYYLKVSLCKEGKIKIYGIHRLMAETFIPNPLNLPQIDHKNRNSSDNRLENLRWCSFLDNQYNRTKRRNTRSKYKGVRWHNRDKRWVAETYLKRKRIHLGSYKKEEDAARAYNDFAREHFREFASLNEI